MPASLDSGDLSATPLGVLLLEALERRATGALSIDDAGTQARVFVRDGLPAGAQSFASFRPLGQILVQQGRIDMDALSRSLAEMARSGRPQGEILVEMGAASRDDVGRALAEQQATYVEAIAARGAGTWSWRAGLPPEWTRGARIPPLRALVAALQPTAARGATDAILSTLAADAIVTLTPPYAGVAHAFAWTGGEAARVERLRAGATADRFAADFGEPLRARAVLAVLLRLGLAAPAGSSSTVPSAVQSLAEANAAPPAAAASKVASPAGDSGARQRLVERAIRGAGAIPPRPPPATTRAAAEVEAAAHGAAAAAVAELRAALAAMLPRAADRDLFARLGVPRTATREQVKQAYLQLAKRFHPDRFLLPALVDLQPSVQQLFAALNEAYDVLGDDRRRTEHLAATGGAWVTDDAAARVDYEKGEACLRTREYRRARGFFEAALRVDPRPEYQAAAAYAIVLEGSPADRERARDLVRGALADPRCDRAAYVAGVLARADGDDAAAERHFRAALHANPRHADAARELRSLEMRRPRNPRK